MSSNNVANDDGFVCALAWTTATHQATATITATLRIISPFGFPGRRSTDYDELDSLDEPRIPATAQRHRRVRLRSVGLSVDDRFVASHERHRRGVVGRGDSRIDDGGRDAARVTKLITQPLFRCSGQAGPDPLQIVDVARLD